MNGATPASTRDVILFGGLSIAYDDRVLVPREWTAMQSRWAAELAAEAPSGPVLELCCGAGHIGLLAAAATERSLVQVDANPIACDYARENARTAGIADRADVRCSDIREAVRPGERFAIVIADPPYLRSDETDRFPDDPLAAIDGGSDGLDVVRLCLDVMAESLVAGGFGLLQLGALDDLRPIAGHRPGELEVVGRRQHDPERQVVLLVRRPDVGSSTAGATDHTRVSGTLPGSVG